MRSRGRAKGVIIASSTLLAISLSLPPVADASVIAKALSPSQSFSTTAIAIFATGVQSYTNTGVAFTSSISNNVAKDFYINNGGSRSVTQFSFTVTLPNSSNVSYFRRCNLGVTFSGANSCSSGSTTNIPITPGTEITLTLPLVQGTFYQFRIIQNKTGTITVRTRVNSSAITPVSSNS